MGVALFPASGVHMQVRQGGSRGPGVVVEWCGCCDDGDGVVVDDSGMVHL